VTLRHITIVKPEPASFALGILKKNTAQLPTPSTQKWYSVSMKIIIANWKSNKSITEAQEWLATFARTAAQIDPQTTVVLAPPMPLVAWLSEQLKVLDLRNLQLGVQDLSPFPAGSYTGATSSKNLEALGVQWAILGHSERRRYFHETYQEVANKVDQALSAGITPIVCVDQPDIAQQMVAIEESNWMECVVAYEPLAAIGSGFEEPAGEVAIVVKGIEEQYHPQAIIYGGSVSASNIKGYLEVTQGALVATHSLEAGDFSSLLLVAN